MSWIRSQRARRRLGLVAALRRDAEAVLDPCGAERLREVVLRPRANLSAAVDQDGRSHAARLDGGRDGSAERGPDEHLPVPKDEGRWSEGWWGEGW